MIGCGTMAAAPTKETPIQPSTTVFSTSAADPGKTSAPDPVTANSADKKWVKVNSWSGSSIKTTEKFTIKGSNWRVNWKSNGKNGNNSIFVLTPTKEDSQLAALATVLGSGSDVSYVQGAGTYYFSIIAADTNWTVTVEEQI
jgi:hypothetical protein